MNSVDILVSNLYIYTDTCNDSKAHNLTSSIYPYHHHMLHIFNYITIYSVLANVRKRVKATLKNTAVVYLS